MIVSIFMSSAYGQNLQEDINRYMTFINNHGQINVSMVVNVYRAECDESPISIRKLNYLFNSHGVRIDDERFSAISKREMTLTIIPEARQMVLDVHDSLETKKWETQPLTKLSKFIQELDSNMNISFFSNDGKKEYWLYPKNKTEKVEYILHVFEEATGYLERTEVVYVDHMAEHTGKKVVYDFGDYSVEDDKAKGDFDLFQYVTAINDTWELSSRYKDYSLTIQ